MDSGETLRLYLALHYDGTRFFGWQVQAEERTVQGELQAALERLTGTARTVTGSGRTDRGVHARGQVASVTVPGRWTPASLHRALNAVLPDDIWITEVRKAHPDFHPRHDAVARTYVYQLGLEPAALSPFHRPWCWPVVGDLDRDALHRAAALIPGNRSFSGFAKAGQPQRGDRCIVTRAEWGPWSGPGMRFTITANRYLHHMVRYLVGTMVDVARGRRPGSEMASLLEDPDTPFVTSPPAPPEGLFLERVEYPAEAAGPRRAKAAGAEGAPRPVDRRRPRATGAGEGGGTGSGAAGPATPARGGRYHPCERPDPPAAPVVPRLAPPDRRAQPRPTP